MSIPTPFRVQNVLSWRVDMGVPDVDIGYVVTRFARCMCTTLFLSRSRQQYVWSCLREKTSELLQRRPFRPWRPWHGSSTSRASRDRHPPLSLLPHERLIFGAESVPDLNSILHLAKSRREECNLSFLSIPSFLSSSSHPDGLTPFLNQFDFTLA